MKNPLAFDLIARMLTLDPHKRITAAEVRTVLSSVGVQSGRQLMQAP